MKNYERPKQMTVRDVKIRDDFWSGVQDLVVDEAIPYQEKVLNDQVEGAEKSHAL